jgi:hypothetical protein
MGTAKHLSLDGGLVSVSADADLTAPAASEATAVVLGGHRQGFACGPSGYGQAVADDRDFGVVVFTEEYEFQRGRLRIGSAPQPVGPDGAVYMETGPLGTSRPDLRWLAVWEGRNFDLKTHRYGGDTSEPIIRSLNEFDIREREHGIALIPRDDGSRPYVRGPSIAKELPGLALVRSVQLTPSVAATVPRHRGTRVRGGELYAGGEGRHLVLTLVGNTAVSMILPNLRSDESEVLATVEEMDIQWNPGAA